MLAKFLTLLRHVFTYAETTQQNQTDIRELQRDVIYLTVEMEKLRSEIRSVKETERGERDKQMLLLENVLLRFEKRLPASKSGKDSK
jgi:hypothetical protein